MMGVLGAYGRDELNNNGKCLLNLATDNILAVTRIHSSARAKAASRTLTTLSSGNALATSSA